jgi:hypothetical protein
VIKEIITGQSTRPMTTTASQAEDGSIMRQPIFHVHGGPKPASAFGDRIQAALQKDQGQASSAAVSHVVLRSVSGDRPLLSTSRRAFEHEKRHTPEAKEDSFHYLRKKTGDGGAPLPKRQESPRKHQHIENGVHGKDLSAALADSAAEPARGIEKRMSSSPDSRKSKPRTQRLPSPSSARPTASPRSVSPEIQMSRKSPSREGASKRDRSRQRPTPKSGSKAQPKRPMPKAASSKAASEQPKL